MMIVVAGILLLIPGFLTDIVGLALFLPPVRTFLWNRLMRNYIAAGGDPVDDKTLRFFRVWAHVRNAAGSNLIAANFAAGLSDELKLAFLPCRTRMTLLRLFLGRASRACAHARDRGPRNR